MSNRAICRKTDEHFTEGEGKEYECTVAYTRCEIAVVQILDDKNELVSVEINDDFFSLEVNR